MAKKRLWEGSVETEIRPRKRASKPPQRLISEEDAVTPGPSTGLPKLRPAPKKRKRRKQRTTPWPSSSKGGKNTPEQGTEPLRAQQERKEQGIEHEASRRRHPRTFCLEVSDQIAEKKATSNGIGNQEAYIMPETQTADGRKIDTPVLEAENEEVVLRKKQTLLTTCVSFAIFMFIAYNMFMQCTGSNAVAKILQERDAVAYENDVHLLLSFLSQDNLVSSFIDGLVQQCYVRHALSVKAESASPSVDISSMVEGADWNFWISAVLISAVFIFFQYCIPLWNHNIQHQHHESTLKSATGSRKEVNGEKLKKIYEAVAKLIPIFNFFNNVMFMTKTHLVFTQIKKLMTSIYGTDSSDAFSYIMPMYIIVLLLWFLAIVNPQMHAQLYFYRWRKFIFEAVLFLAMYTSLYTYMSTSVLSREYIVKGQLGTLIRNSYTYKLESGDIVHSEVFENSWKNLQKGIKNNAYNLFASFKNLAEFLKLFVPATLGFFIFVFLFRMLFIEGETQTNHHSITVLRNLNIVVKFGGSDVLKFAVNKSDLGTQQHNFHVKRAMFASVLQMLVMHTLINSEYSDMASLGCGQVYMFDWIMMFSYCCCVGKFVIDTNKYNVFVRNPEDTLGCLKDDNCNTYRTFYAHPSFSWTFASQNACYIFVVLIYPISNVIQILWVNFSSPKDADVLDMSLDSFIFNVAATEHLAKHISALVWGLLCFFTRASLLGDYQEDTISTNGESICGVCWELTQEVFVTT